MKKILFATKNESKGNRFRSGLLENNIEVMTLKDIDIDIDVEENGKDGVENALIKARAYYEKSNITTMAMDDCLYIDNIPDNLQPGTHVRRVNGKRLDDEEMIEYYSNLAKKYGTNGKLTARYIYGLAIIKDGIEKTYTWSYEDFDLIDKPSEKRNPGYPLNSISINRKLNKYLTDITQEEKKKINNNESHVLEFIIANC